MALVNTLLLSLCGLAILAPLVLGDGQCIKGKYHKANPSAETGFQICQEYSNNTCCTKDFTVKLKRSRAEELYNHSWYNCGQLSSQCEKFWVQQECFYQCSPYVYKWQHPSLDHGIHGAPICSSVCDDWFEACKDDKICVQDVLTGYKFLTNGTNRCPDNSTCKTYQSMFTNGEGLCNNMWNTSYVYTKENADKSNCMVMNFTGPNPNGNVVKPTPVPTSAPTGPSGVALVLEASAVIMITLLGLVGGFAA